jgi:hypothetical protein
VALKSTVDDIIKNINENWWFLNILFNIPHTFVHTINTIKSSVLKRQNFTQKFSQKKIIINPGKIKKNYGFPYFPQHLLLLLLLIILFYDFPED